MKYIPLPNTDLTVSRIALGTAGLGTVNSQEESFEILDRYLAAGGTFLDTAHVYANWVPGERSRSEKTIGAWLKARGHHEDLVIATKGGHEDMAAPDQPRVTPELVAADLEESLQYLGLDRIDLYWLHRDDPTQPVGPLVEMLNAQVTAGKIRYFACSNWEPARIIAAQQYATKQGLRSFAASQILWGLARPNPGAVTPVHAIMTEESWPFYAGGQLGVMAFTSQARGFFARAVAGGLDSLKPELRQAFENQITLQRLARVHELADQLKATATAVVLAYITSQQIAAVALIGINTLAQLQDSLTNPDLTLTPEQIAYLIGSAGMP